MNEYDDPIEEACDSLRRWQRERAMLAFAVEGWGEALAQTCCGDHLVEQIDGDPLAALRHTDATRNGGDLDA